MPELVCDTSALQYLHQLGKLELVDYLVDGVVVPPAVVQELEDGRDAGVDLPRVREIEWIEIRHPAGECDAPLVTDMGPGETEVLMLTIEQSATVALLDDKLPRDVARRLGLKFTGTLGLLLDAKKSGLIAEVRPLLDGLDELGFHVSPQTRQTILRRAGEGGG